jgi:anti-sigma regulatory factor (Ser/Thr protein kinase)
MMEFDMLDVTPEMRMATAAEEVSRYVGEIAEMLRDLSSRSDIDNEQLTRIATAVTEIQHIASLMLQR